MWWLENQKMSATKNCDYKTNLVWCGRACCTHWYQICGAAWQVFGTVRFFAVHQTVSWQALITIVLVCPNICVWVSFQHFYCKTPWLRSPINNITWGSADVGFHEAKGRVKSDSGVTMCDILIWPPQLWVNAFIPRIVPNNKNRDGNPMWYCWNIPWANITWICHCLWYNVHFHTNGKHGFAILRDVLILQL